MAAKKTTRPSVAERKDGKAAVRKLTRTLVMAGTTRDDEGKFVGYDGEQMRFAGQKFYVYGDKLPSWCRVLKDGQWVNAVEPKGRKIQRPEIRRAAPGTLPGQAPKERIRQLVEDDAAARRGEELEPLEVEDEAPLEVTDSGEGGEDDGEGRASDKEVG